MRYVLDANMAIAAMNGVAAVRDRLARISASEVGIPLVAIAELVYGAYRSRRRAENWHMSTLFGGRFSRCR